MTKDQIKELRRLLREAMLARDKNTCQYCGSKTRVLATSHIYPKGKYRKMEYDLDNVVALCNMPCHLGWWHKEPIEAGAWIKDYLNPERYKRLKMRAQVIDKTPLDYNLLRLSLIQDIKNYGS